MQHPLLGVAKSKIRKDLVVEFDIQGFALITLEGIYLG